jgi:uncharacterized cupin superfamily protein
MSAYRAAQLDEIVAEQWPYWAPIRHHFGIETFGINAWRGADGDEVIKRHHEQESGAPELYVVLSGSATFDVNGEEIQAPAGTCVWIDDPAAERAAFAKTDGTVVLSVAAGPKGEAFTPSGWDTSYLEGS